MSDIEFSASAYEKGGDALVSLAQDISGSGREFLGSVSDKESLGTNDLLGAVCQAIYEIVHVAVEESIGTVEQDLADTGERLIAAGQAYRETEEAAVRDAENVSMEAR